MDTLVIPVGGGGLAAGIATAVRSARPDVKIHGVQTRLCPAMYHAIRDEETPALRTDTLADGIAVKGPGKLTIPILKELLDDVLLVDEAAIEQAVQQLLMETNLLAEGAGASGVAAILSNAEMFRGQKVVTVLCGANIDSRMLSTVLLRGMKRDGRITRLTVDIQDTPGTMAAVTQLIGSTGADIVDILHQRLFADVTSRRAHLEVVLETRSNAHVERLLETLDAAGYPAKRS